MDVALVLVFAAGAGVLVYRLAMKPDHPVIGDGFLSAEEPERPPQAESPQTRAPDGWMSEGTGMSYVPLASGRRTWRTRLTGLAGIVILIPLVGVILAVVLYQFGHFVNQTLSSMLNGGGG